MRTTTYTELNLDGNWGIEAPRWIVVDTDWVTLELPDGTTIRGRADGVRETLVDMLDALDRAYPRTEVPA